MQDDCITIHLGLREMRVICQKETDKEIIVEAMYRAKSSICPSCGHYTPKVHSVQEQRKRDRWLRDKPVFLVLHKRRFRCLFCNKVFTEPDGVFGKRRRSTLRFRQHLGEEALHQTIRHVARKEGVGEGLVRRCLTEMAAEILQSQEEMATKTEVMGLDEFSVKKGHIYDTTICDLKERQVVGVVGGRGKKGLEEWFNKLPEPERVQVVVMDMHEPFRQAVQMCLPKAEIVADEFHVIRQVNRALDQVRVECQGQEGRGRRGELFKARYLLLKAGERLTVEQESQLSDLSRAYPELNEAWALKEGFRLWYRSANREEAEEGLALWEKAVKEGPKAFRSVLPMLRNWREEILNYFDHRYTNGFVEGKNNRIKVIKRIAYGYRNSNNFRQRILMSNRKESLPQAV